MTERFTGPDGHVVHAVVAVDSVRFAVKDADGVDPAPTSEPLAADQIQTRTATMYP